MNTHYAAIHFSGDLDGDHADPELRDASPSLTLIAAGPEEFCWQALSAWTTTHPLREGETAEVLTRHLSVVQPVPRTCA